MIVFINLLGLWLKWYANSLLCICRSKIDSKHKSCCSICIGDEIYCWTAISKKNSKFMSKQCHCVIWSLNIFGVFRFWYHMMNKTKYIRNKLQPAIIFHLMYVWRTWCGLCHYFVRTTCSRFRIVTFAAKQPFNLLSACTLAANCFARMSICAFLSAIVIFVLSVTSV